MCQDATDAGRTEGLPNAEREEWSTCAAISVVQRGRTRSSSGPVGVLCGVITGAFLGALDYVGRRKYVEKRPVDWSVAGYKAGVGAVQGGLGSGAVQRYLKRTGGKYVASAVNTMAKYIKRGLKRLRWRKLAALTAIIAQIVVTAVYQPPPNKR